MISCSDYDYIEIVCMYRYPVQLTLNCGEVRTGVALDTKRNQAREECIELQIEDTKTLIVLEQIAKLKVEVENPHFSEVSFS